MPQTAQKLASPGYVFLHFTHIFPVVDVFPAFGPGPGALGTGMPLTLDLLGGATGLCGVRGDLGAGDR
jgi:hypothetical protein